MTVELSNKQCLTWLLHSLKPETFKNRLLLVFLGQLHCNCSIVDSGNGFLVFKHLSVYICTRLRVYGLLILFRVNNSHFFYRSLFICMPIGNLASYTYLKYDNYN